MMNRPISSSRHHLLQAGELLRVGDVPSEGVDNVEVPGGLGLQAARLDAAVQDGLAVFGVDEEHVRRRRRRSR